MKHPALYTSLCLLGVFVSYTLFKSEVAGVDNQNAKANAKTESMATGERKVSDFNRVVLLGKGTLQIKQTGKETLTIEADKEIEGEITAEVKYGELIISHKGKGWFSRLFSSEKPITYTLTVKELAGLTIDGSGIVQGQSEIKGDKLNLSINGSGSMQLEVQVKDVHGSISGSGKMYLLGSTQEQTVNVRGAGEYEAAELSSKTATVKLLGAGDVILNVSKDLDVSISGSGNVTYQGQPKVNKHITGSGNVIPLQR